MNTMLENPTMAGDALAKLRGMLASLSPSERKIGEYIAENFELVLRMTLNEVAKKSGVSDATAVRFYRSLGYKRWLDFKIALSCALPASPQMVYGEIDASESALEITHKVFQNAVQALGETYAVLDEKTLEQAIDLIRRARKVLIVGAGTSAPMAREMFNRLFRLGINCLVETDGYVQIMQSALLTDQDVLVVISQTGDSSSPVRTAAEAKRHGCPVICITGNRLSDLAQVSDVILLSVSHEILQETIASRIAQYALIHAIYINLAVRISDVASRNDRLIWDALTGYGIS